VRTITLLLLAANLVFFAWAQGWLNPVLMAPMSSEREPDRLSAQVRPEAIKLLGANEAERARRDAGESRTAPGAAASASAEVRNGR
jgi:hypothetical protein